MCAVHVSRARRKEPLIPFSVPDVPFQVVGADLFSISGYSYLLIVDYLTKWPIVKKLSYSTSTAVVIQSLKESFADFGIPETVISDIGPQFSSYEFKKYCAEQGLVHKTSSPLHPAGNGQTERTIGTVKGMMKKCIEEGSNWLKGRIALRNTPMAAGLPSPTELLQGRYLRDSLPVDIDKCKVRSYNRNR